MQLSHLVNMRLSVVMLFLIGSQLPAQIFNPPALDAPHRTFWGFVELGAGRAANSAVLASSIGGAVQVRQTLFLGRISSLDGGIDQDYQDVSFLVGRASPPGRVHYSAAAGLGVTTGRRSASISLPIEVQVMRRPNPWFGIGARAFANLNFITGSRGGALVMQVGRLH